jgi:F1F0 ATPase subunit 2
MTDQFSWALAGIAGLLLGAIFFGGLWWTVKKGASVQYPALLFFGSALVRMVVALAGFYFVSGGQWKRLLTCLLGFIAARLAVSRLTRPSGDNQIRPIQEARRAP